jgi:gliding motility-associated-like protein
MNKLDSFDKALRDSLENYEVEYDPSQWSRLESNLGSAPSGSGFPWLAVASIGGIVGGGLLVYHLLNTDINHSSESPVVHHNITVQPEEPNTNNNTLTPVFGNTNEDENISSTIEITPPVHNPVVRENEKRDSEIKPVEIVVVEPPVNTNQNSNNSNTSLNNSHSVVDLPVPSFRLQTEVCQGEEILLSANNAPANAEVSWEISNGQILSGKNATLVIDFPGKYSISLRYSNGKTTSVATEESIEILSSPEPFFTWGEEYVNGRPMIQFANKTADAQFSSWIFEDGTTSSEKETQRFYRYKGEYSIGLEAVSENGCKAISKQTIVISEDYKLLAPNSFSPNGDGNNDEFIPEALKVMDAEFTLTIYDRSNKLVYSTRSANKPWDGRFMSDNQLAPAGVYVWVVTVKGEQPYVGTVTLLER